MAVKTKKPIQVEMLSLLIDNLTYSDDASKRRKPNTFHASSIEDCRRQQWYGVMGYQPAEDDGKNPHWKRSAESGNALHEQWQERLIRSGVVMTRDDFFALVGWRLEDYPEPTRSFLLELPYATEIPLIPNEYRIGGRLDVVVNINETYFITDIKTVDQKKFDDGVSGYKFKKYKAQLQIYMRFTGIKQAIVLLINRNDLKQKEFLIEYDEEWCTDQLERISILNEQVKANILPPPEPEFMACKFCPFNMLCAFDYQ